MIQQFDEFTLSKFKLMKTKEIAQLFDVTIPTVLSWVHKERLPAIKIRHTFRFRKEDVEQFVEENALTPRLQE